MSNSNRETRLFSIFDKKTGFYNAPFPADHQRVAERRFADSVMDQNSRIAQYPDEFELYETAVLDSETGKIENLEQFRYICNGVNVDAGKRRAPNAITTEAGSEK